MRRSNKRVLAGMGLVARVAAGLGLVAACLWGSLTAIGAVSAAPQPLVYAQAGDVSARSAVIWGRCNREVDARLVVDLATSPVFDGSEPAHVGPQVGRDTDYTGSVEVHGLQPDTTYYYRVRCVPKPGRGQDSTADLGPTGTLRTAPDRRQARAVRSAMLYEKVLDPQ